MVKHSQTIGRLLPTKCLKVFDHFVRLALKGLKEYNFELKNLIHDSAYEKVFENIPQIRR